MGRRINIYLIGGLIGCTTTQPQPYLCKECPETNIIDMVEAPWETVDKAAFARAQVVCKEQYGPENPCVGQFTRFEIGNYNVLCGPANQFKCKEEK